LEGEKREVTFQRVGQAPARGLGLLVLQGGELGNKLMVRFVPIPHELTPRSQTKRKFDVSQTRKAVAFFPLMLHNPTQQCNAASHQNQIRRVTGVVSPSSSFSSS
jgi:hypothetical protein